MQLQQQEISLATAFFFCHGDKHQLWVLCPYYLKEKQWQWLCPSACLPVSDPNWINPAHSLKRLPIVVIGHMQPFSANSLCPSRLPFSCLNMDCKQCAQAFPTLRSHIKEAGISNLGWGGVYEGIWPAQGVGRVGGNGIVYPAVWESGGQK